MSDYNDTSEEQKTQAGGEPAGEKGQAAGSGFTEQPGRPNLAEETDLSGMDLQAAREYVLAYIQTLKETQQVIARQKEEVALWQNRMQLAEQQNRLDLKTAAGVKKGEAEAKLATLLAEEKDLLEKVAVLKENLRKLKHKFQYSIDTEQLLAELEMLVGEEDKLKYKFKHEDAQAELERLKASLKEPKE